MHQQHQLNTQPEGGREEGGCQYKSKSTLYLPRPLAGSCLLVNRAGEYDEIVLMIKVSLDLYEAPSFIVQYCKTHFTAVYVTDTLYSEPGNAARARTTMDNAMLMHTS